MRIGKVQYNGVSSDTLGVFVSGSGSYDAAEFDVTNYQVPGRNGDILIPNNRYKNIDITYPCFIPNDFETRVQAVRNWMRSARSYARIEDNYDLLHYRMGIGKGVLKFSPAQQSIGANAQLVFNCKPQRFLKSGEEEQDVVRTPYSFTGDTVEFETDEVKTLEKAEVTLSPSQNGTPWVSATPDTEPYLYRALPNNVGNAELDTIVGGTVNFNQLASLSSSDWTLTLITFTASGTEIKINPSLESNNTKYIAKTATKGHKYLMSGTYVNSESNYGFSYGVYFAGSSSYEERITISWSSGGVDVPFSYIFNVQNDSRQLRVQMGTAAETTNYTTIDKLQIFDLTAMFGSSIADYIYTLESGTAGAGVAWLKKYGFLTAPYYAYDAGSLLSVKTSAHITTGKNLIPTEVPSNIISGTFSTSNTTIQSASNAKVFAVPVPQNTTIFVQKKDGDVDGHNLALGDTGTIAVGTPIYSPKGFTNVSTATFNTGSHAWLYVQSTTLAIAEKLWSTAEFMVSVGSTRQDYVAPTEPHTYALDSDLELRGPLSLDANNNLVYDGDVYPPSGSVTRNYRLVQLSTIASKFSKNSGTGLYEVVMNTNAMGSGFNRAYGTDVKLICNKYDFYGNATSSALASNLQDMQFGAYRTSATVSFRNDSITTLDAFKNSLSDVYLLYPLANPYTATADPYTSPQSVSDGGTEEYVDSRTVPMPVGHRTYYANIVPITGETGTNLIHTGVNLLGGTALKDAVVASMPSATVDTTNKYVSFASGAKTNQPITASLSGTFKENTRYTFIMTIYKTAGTGSNLDIRYTDGTHALLGTVSAATTKETLVFVSDANKTVASMIKYNQSGYTRLYYEESGIFEGVLTASQFKEYQGGTYNVTFTDQGTVYGGTYDFVSGTLTVTHGCIASYNGETIGTPWLSSYEEYSVGATPTTGAQVVYPLDSPHTYTLTPNVINSVIGLNYVWSDYPPVSVGYSDPFDAHNPTQYDAKPLLKLENPLTGAVINVNAFTITATTSYTGVVEIDCESQNIFDGDTNLNGNFTVANFPVLQSGSNVITFSDADSLKIVPRWWEL